MLLVYASHSVKTMLIEITGHFQENCHMMKELLLKLYELNYKKIKIIC